MKFLIASIVHTSFSSLLGPNIRLRILFSNALSLDSSLNVRDHASQPCSLCIAVWIRLGTIMNHRLGNVSSHRLVHNLWKFYWFKELQFPYDLADTPLRWSSPAKKNKAWRDGKNLIRFMPTVFCLTRSGKQNPVRCSITYMMFSQQCVLHEKHGTQDRSRVRSMDFFRT